LVVLAPAVGGGRAGLLVIRRAIEARRGRLALVGGFLEAPESWQRGGAREVREEAGVTVDPAALEPPGWNMPGRCSTLVPPSRSRAGQPACSRS
jgi:ADP-ribose pyrophosphatase YjhB (NUDIX family)